MPLDKTPWTEETIFSWGEHKGTALKDVPPSYLLNLLSQKWILDWPGLYSYLRRHQDDFRKLVGEDDAARNSDHSEGYDSYDDYIKDRRD